MIDLALQKNGLFIDAQESDDRSPPPLPSKEREALGVFPFKEKGSPQNLGGNDRSLSSAASELDLDHKRLSLPFGSVFEGISQDIPLRLLHVISYRLVHLIYVPFLDCLNYPLVPLDRPQYIIDQIDTLNSIS